MASNPDASATVPTLGIFEHHRTITIGSRQLHMGGLQWGHDTKSADTKPREERTP